MRWALFVLLAGCVEQKVDTGTAPVPPWETDDDGDGYTADTDCDDTDAGIHPGAREICDGLDQDCDDAIDDSATDALMWYPDDDGDGYGDAHHGIVSCDPIPTYIADGTDCDDDAADAHPGATEACDGIDNDCNGDTDEGAPDGSPTWYYDADHDGFGDPALAAVICLAPDGFVADGTDCDDNSATTFPGAAERCDLADDDCNGLVDDIPVDGTTWYTDRDADGYGDHATGAVACGRLPGTSPDGTDCDDTRADVSPAATEVCNGVDDDCDRTIDEDDAADAGTWYADHDGDGHGASSFTTVACAQPLGYVTAGDDCDDAVATVSPDGVEVCDGTDDDCDGAIDEDPADGSAWHPDADGDGYGDPAVTADACTAPAGYLTDATDCDDADPSAFPGATEYCDGADDDCDGVADDDAVDETLWYADADGDGTGDPLVSRLACTAPPDMVADATDCDDTEALAAPGRTEACNDGIDNDCDGTDDGCAMSGDLAIESVYTTRYYEEDFDDDFGGSVAVAGDTDGDGIPDVVIGAPATWDGAVYLFSGRHYGDVGATTAVGTLTGPGLIYLGNSVAAAGDTDGDGLDDVLVGSDGNAWLFSGPWSGSMDTSMASRRLTHTDEISVAGAGDLDGDGLSDFVMGVSRASEAASWDGGVCVTYGGGTGTLYLNTCDGILEGGAVYMGFGTSVSGVGDLDGDGLDDLLVGAPGDATNGTYAGAAYIVQGPASGIITASASYGVLLGGAAYDFAGQTVASAGDTDGDGVPELLVGAIYQDGGAVSGGAAYVVRAPFAGTIQLSASADQVFGSHASDMVGTALSGAGDLDGDGIGDWIAGVSAWDGTGTSSGLASVWYGPGPFATSPDTADVRFTGAAAGDYAGCAVAGGADLTGDGVDDVLIGAAGASHVATGTGTVYVVAGSGL